MEFDIMYALSHKESFKKLILLARPIDNSYCIFFARKYIVGPFHLKPPIPFYGA